jgi:hypothetical protein
MVCLSIQHGVQRFFHRAANYLTKIDSDAGLVDLIT